LAVGIGTIREELKLDVVRIAEHEHERPLDRVGRRDRRRRDACTIQSKCPRVELVTVPHGEREVVESGSGLVEFLETTVAVLRQAEPDGEVVMPKEDLAASAVGRFVPVDAPEPEHLLVPRRAVLDVAHGEAKVVESSDHH
jgi:hypothetical protein